MNGFKATKRGLVNSSKSHQLRCPARFNRTRLRKLAAGAAWLSSTFAVVIVAVYGVLLVETELAPNPKPEPSESSYLFPWEDAAGLLHALKESAILASLDSVSVITALVLFVLVGRREEERQAHYIAWFMLDAAHNRETSYARYNALQDLNHEGISLRGLDAPRTDLIGIRLNEADLQQATLEDAKLQKADLQRANLTSSNLQRANLVGATLEKAVLFNAKLNGSNVGGANLRRADLCYANLQGANFLDANLQGADLSDANLDGASFLKARNLTVAQVKQARNWETATYDEDFCKQLFSAVTSSDRKFLPSKR